MGDVGAVDGMYERGMKVRLRDRRWEVEAVHAAGKDVLLDLRRADDRPGPLRLSIIAGLEPTLRPEPATPLRFATGNPVRLNELHSALALTMAHGRGDLLAAEHGRIDVEPYQLVPVLAGLRQPSTRLLVADDVGLGKTIEAGLLLLELARRGRADRVLIASPAGLQDQWIEEMRFRFNLEFVKVDSRKWLELRRDNPTTLSPWTAVPFAVSSIDYLKNNLAAIQAAPKFDVVVIDEAQHVARSFAGDGRSNATDRSRMARTLADHCRELILLSATPHNGYKESFASLVQLLSPHLAADDGRVDPDTLGTYIVRRLKDDVARGNPPQPISRRNTPQPIPVRPTAREKEIHQRLRGHSKRMLSALKNTDSYHVEAFALEVLRKRSLSSPYALLKTLEKRAASLGAIAVDHAGKRRLDAQRLYRSDTVLPEADLLAAEELALSGVPQRYSGDELAEERRLIATLLELVRKVGPGDDSKLTELKGWLRGFRAGRRGDRVIIFTEYRDTLEYLQANLTGIGQILRIDGTVPLKERYHVLETFAHTPGAILLATDAAGEGLNMQDCCHVVVHYELPWNPNRLEQRNGRVDRYGQKQIVEISYLYLEDTRDEDILRRLREKLAEITQQLGSAGDVLGVGGRSDVIDALLEDLEPEELERRLEAAANQVRAYLEETGALAVLRSKPDEQQAEAEASASREQSTWLLPGFEEFRDLVTSVLRQDGGSIAGAGDLFTINPGPTLSQYPGVPKEPFPATFSRAVALDPENRGVAFLTPVHPLVRAVLQRVRTRLYTPTADDRCAVRAVSGTGEGWLFTAIGRLLADDGRLLEEPLIPVFVPRTGEGVPSFASMDEPGDTRRLKSKGVRVDSVAAAGVALERLAPGFDAAAIFAIAEAERRLADRAEDTRAQLAEQARRLGADLERWKNAELAEAERRFESSRDGESVQLGLFADIGHGEFATIDEARKIVEEEFQVRRSALQHGFDVATITQPELVGCVLCVEAASC